MIELLFIPPSYFAVCHNGLVVDDYFLFCRIFSYLVCWETLLIIHFVDYYLLYHQWKSIDFIFYYRITGYQHSSFISYYLQTWRHLCTSVPKGTYENCSMACCTLHFSWFFICHLSSLIQPRKCETAMSNEERIEIIPYK